MLFQVSTRLQNIGLYSPPLITKSVLGVLNLSFLSLIYQPLKSNIYSRVWCLTKFLVLCRGLNSVHSEQGHCDPLIDCNFEDLFEVLTQQITVNLSKPIQYCACIRKNGQCFSVKIPTYYFITLFGAIFERSRVNGYKNVIKLITGVKINCFRHFYINGYTS